MPNLTTLVLTNNNLAELGDLEPLKDVKGLQFLSLLGNPARDKKWYREWLAWRIPGLRVLDFQRIRDVVRDIVDLVQARAETSSTILLGTPYREVSVPHGRQPAHAARHHALDHRVHTHQDGRDHRRAQTRRDPRQGGAPDVQGGGAAREGRDRKSDVSRRDQELREESEGGIPAGHGGRRCMMRDVARRSKMYSSSGVTVVYSWGHGEQSASCTYDPGYIDVNGASTVTAALLGLALGEGDVTSASIWAYAYNPTPLFPIHNPWKTKATIAERLSNELTPCSCENLEFNDFIACETCGPEVCQYVSSALSSSMFTYAGLIIAFPLFLLQLVALEHCPAIER